MVPSTLWLAIIADMTCMQLLTVGKPASKPVPEGLACWSFRGTSGAMYLGSAVRRLRLRTTVSNLLNQLQEVAY